MDRKVVVVGAGIAGLSIARRLADAGEAVTLLERTPDEGGCSWMNGGWLNRQDLAPLPAPGLLRAAMTGYPRKDAPFRAYPSGPGDLLFLARMASGCRATPYLAGVRALASLVGDTADMGAEWEQDGICKIRRTGHLHVITDGSDPAALVGGYRHVLEQMQPVAVQPLDAGPARRLVPHLSRRVSGGLYFPDASHVRPAEVMAGLTERFTGTGGRLVRRTQVKGFMTKGRRVMSCATTSGHFAADVFVVTAGAATSMLTARLGVPLPVKAGHGYSYDLQTHHDLGGPTVVFGGKKIGVSPTSSGLRVLGMMDFGHVTDQVASRRGARMLEALGDYVDQEVLAGASIARGPVRGRRPVTPDGLPVIDRLPGLDNAYVSTGHGMLGVMLAQATARALASYIGSSQRPAVLEPFRAGRFRTGLPGGARTGPDLRRS